MRKFGTIAVIAVMSVALAGCGERGNGEKIGMITKLAKEGFWCPTWEASIQRGGFNAGSGVGGAAFEFTIEDPALVEQVRNVMEKQLEVKISYRTEVITFCRSDSSDHFLTKIEVIGKGEAGKANVVLEEESSSAPAPKVYPKMTKEEALNALINQNQQILDIIKGL